MDPDTAETLDCRRAERAQNQSPFLRKYVPRILKLDVQNDPFYEKVGSFGKPCQMETEVPLFLYWEIDQCSREELFAYTETCDTVLKVAIFF